MMSRLVVDFIWEIGILSPYLLQEQEGLSRPQNFLRRAAH
jgi:hypothetical protein